MRDMNEMCHHRRTPDPRRNGAQRLVVGAAMAGRYGSGCGSGDGAPARLSHGPVGWRRRAAALAAILAAATATGACADGSPPVPSAARDRDYRATDPAAEALGRLLFYDPVLSGNREVACATCHHPRHATGDGVALGIGDGGRGLGPKRRADPGNPPERRIPRNAPSLFNLGAHEFTVMFADGRVEAEVGRPSDMRTPMDADMLEGFDGVLSAQTMFPVLSPDEMAGHYSENDVSRAVRQGRITGPGGAWDVLTARVTAIPEYADGFAAAYPHIGEGAPVSFADVSNAIAAFIAAEWRSDDSPFDAHLRGEVLLGGAQARGMTLFYGEAGCAACHSGTFQTDHAFHATGAPQIGPGKAARFEDHRRDDGRMRVTGDPADAYAFRTPSLRNVTRTGPWGHAGAHDDLAAFLLHHADPSRPPPPLPDLPDGTGDIPDTADTADAAAILTAVTAPPVGLEEAEVAALMAFMAALEDPVALAGRTGIPRTVPSGLPVPR